MSRGTTDREPARLLRKVHAAEKVLKARLLPQRVEPGLHRVGRRRILLVAWGFGIPVPLLLMWAPSWGWVGFANLLLGINQGLAWSTTQFMKMDLAGPRQRGLVMGLNECAGYLAVATAALGAAYLAAAYGPRPAPYFIALAAAVLGFGVTFVAARDTAAHVELV